MTNYLEFFGMGYLLDENVYLEGYHGEPSIKQGSDPGNDANSAQLRILQVMTCVRVTAHLTTRTRWLGADDLHTLRMIGPQQTCEPADHGPVFKDNKLNFRRLRELRILEPSLLPGMHLQTAQAHLPASTKISAGCSSDWAPLRTYWKNREWPREPDQEPNLSL